MDKSNIPSPPPVQLRHRRAASEFLGLGRSWFDLLDVLFLLSFGTDSLGLGVVLLGGPQGELAQRT